MPGNEEQPDHREQLGLTECIFILLYSYQTADEIVARMRALLVEQRLEVGERPPYNRSHCRLLSRFPIRAERLQHPVAKVLAIRGRYSQHFGNHRHGQWKGKI